ncbi:hypothetical protein [Streptomyces ipomoeae]|uniref:hypothetical protein n=1 Tax=Streptomyces ipomoeae TaxID=103232 RepID=UPI0029A415CB|nr:hypothetical protein [Streptomyces ipomoeae]MDX2692217.1 hypothetical protein [Streptomyces ipomoeae]MDX2843577.1 hypothetical protein [Streptomyces ipomoeae]
MTDWSTTTLVAINDEYDRDAGDSNAPLDSRFGRYLTQRIEDLWEEDRDNPADFLCWAWAVATPPIMAPGYVRIRPDLKGVRLSRSQYDGRLLLEITTPVGHGQLAKGVRPPYAVRDWEIGRFSGGDRFQPLHAPEDESKPALLLSAVLALPADDWPLHQPAGKWPLEELLVDDAKNAVAVAVEHINRTAGHQIAALIGSEGGHW